MPFSYERTIRLSDTDAAGIVFFANYLALCHEAYEAALDDAGLPLHEFFADGDVIVPIARSTADYLRPLRCGDRIKIALKPEALSDNSFALNYEILRMTAPVKVAARVRTEHVSTSRSKKERVALPPKLATWVSAG
ncbi:MAG: acyl-CoA thioesterase [Cephaloticoccus sp.]|nr:acyl-CoA thioesterase [Cephaloticoccus sp.]MCF7760491.1 acyl-CoA thioesterase [Cephaloticoccus sp.]